MCYQKHLEAKLHCSCHGSRPPPHSRHSSPSPLAVRFKTLWDLCEIMLNVETQWLWQQEQNKRCFVPFRPHCHLTFPVFPMPSYATFDTLQVQALSRVPAHFQLPSRSVYSVLLYTTSPHLNLVRVL